MPAFLLVLIACVGAFSQDNGLLPAGRINALVHAGSGRWLASTDLGIFRREAKETAWSKVYPDSGYAPARPLWQGASGSLHTQSLPVRVGTVTMSLALMSADGAAWAPDTEGIALLAGAALFYVDERSCQYASSLASPGALSLTYRKLDGGAWRMDTLGFSLDPAQPFASQPIGFGSDGVGYSYASFSNGNVYRQPIDDNVWSLDTAALVDRGFRRFWTGKEGALFASGDLGGLYRRQRGAWIKLATPAGTAEDHVYAVAADSGGAVFAAFQNTSSDTGDGIYWTLDGGQNWKHLGLDGITVNALVPAGDSLYAATDRGIVAMTREGANAIGPAAAAHAQSRASLQARGSKLRADFGMAASGRVSLKAFDIRGRLRSVLADQAMAAGTHALEFETRGLGGGIYICRLQAPGNPRVNPLLPLSAIANP
jgi:hypothetical protein